jgi:HK97 family phage portal protein
MVNPVRTNLPYGGAVGQLLTNTPDAWELQQGAVSWLSVADDGTPPAWWIGRSVETGFGGIGPHGPDGWHGAMTLPVVTRAESLLVDPLTTNPFQVFRDGQPVASPSWLTDPQLMRPLPGGSFGALHALDRRPRPVFWRKWIVSSLRWGRSYLRFMVNQAGDPVPGSLILTSRLEVTRDDKGGWWFREDIPVNGEGRFPGANGTTWQLVALHNPHSEVGVFAAHPETFELARRINSYTGGVFGSGVPNGYLKVQAQGLTQEQADLLKERWLAAHGGDRRSIAVLNSTTDFTPISWNPVDSALAEVKRLSIADVAFAFGMAPETLGVTLGNSATYSNVEQWFEAHRDFALQPWISTVEATLSALFPAGTEVRCNFASYTDSAAGVTKGLWTGEGGSDATA